jgi:ABC-type nitrate/sulfonate/bicarbonate transport system substrate-binding protein
MALFLAVAALAAAARADSPALDVVRLSQTISTEAQVADAQGFFKQEGIQIQWTGKQAHGPAVLVTVVAGENDFAGTVSSAVFLDRYRGAKLKIIAPTSSSSAGHPSYHYLVKDSSPIKVAQDLVGKKVVAQPTTITWYPIVVWLKRNGVDYNQVEFVNLPSPLAALQAFEDGKVDVLGVNDTTPTWALLQAKGGYHAIPGVTEVDVLNVSQIGGWVTREDFIAQHPDVVRRFVKALSLGLVWANAHPEEAQAILNRLNELPAALIPYSKWRPESPELVVDVDSIHKWGAILEEFGQIPKGAVKPEDVYTNQFNPGRTDHD